MTQRIDVNYDEPIALFPLPNCVLLPSATLPLHIFEPRYRAMTAAALETTKLIAMALFDGDDWRSDYQGNPPIRPHVCVGYIVRHQLLPDGRYNLLLQGLDRARIVDELADEPYRSAILEPTEINPPDESRLADDRPAIENMFQDRWLRDLASISAVRNWLSKAIPTHALIDLTIMTVCENTDERYQMLAEPCVFARAQWLASSLKRLRKTVRQAERFRTADQPDGTTLN